MAVGVWIPRRRLLSSYYEVTRSEQREPDDRWENGFRSRVYTADTKVSLLDFYGEQIHFAALFHTFDGRIWVNLTAEGTLEPLQSEYFGAGNNPKITFPTLGESTSGDAFKSYSGWLEIYASGNLTATAWVDYYENPMWEQWGHQWIRPLGLIDAVIPDPNATFSIVEGLPSAKWPEAERPGQRDTTDPPHTAPSRPSWLPVGIDSGGNKVRLDWVAHYAAIPGGKFRLRIEAAQNITWWKKVYIEAKGKRVGPELETKDQKHEVEHTYNVADIPAQAEIVLEKGRHARLARRRRSLSRRRP